MINKTVQEKIREAYVVKGFPAEAIAALVDISTEEVTAVIRELKLESKRALFLAENPAVSARLANQMQLASILKKRQAGEELFPAELTFLTKLADQQRMDTKDDRADYYQMTKEQLDEQIFKMVSKLYGVSKSNFFRAKKEGRR